MVPKIFDRVTVGKIDRINHVQVAIDVNFHRATNAHLVFDQIVVIADRTRNSVGKRITVIIENKACHDNAAKINNSRTATTFLNFFT